MKKWFFIIFINLLSLNLFAQNKTDSLISVYLQEAKVLIARNNFSEAEKTIKKVFDTKSVLPDETVYLYGITQFGLGNYKGSITAMEKYLSLTGKKGDYYNEAQQYIKDAHCHESGYYEAVEICDMCFGSGDEEAPCPNCRGKGKILCTVCKGSGVNRVSKSYGDSYHKCNKCEGTGFGNCGQCKGKAIVRIACISCQGSGKIKVRRKCNK